VRLCQSWALYSGRLRADAVELSLFPELSEKISEQRYGELRETGASRVVTACPICFTNLAKDEKTIEISDFLIEKLRK
jgi:Fe-S oxidoreductase